MSKRNLGPALVLTLLIAGCTAPTRSYVDQREPAVMMHSDRLESLAGEMSNVASKKAWYGKYFGGVLHGAWVQGPDLFLEVFDPAARHFEVYRVDLKSGTPAWKVILGSQPSKFPPQAGDRLVTFLLDHGGGMVVVTRREGTHLGVLNVPLNLVPTGSAGSSDSTVYIPSLVDRRVHAVNPADGTSGWSYRTLGFIEGSPVVLPRHPRRLLVLGTDGGQIVALPTTAWNETPPGGPSWTFDLLGDLGGPMSVAEQTSDGRHEVSLLAPCMDKGLYCIDAASGEARWVYRTNQPFRGEPMAAGGKVFARNDQRLCVVDMATGTDAFGPPEPNHGLRPFEAAQGVFTADATRAYLNVGEKRVVRIDAKSGAVLRTATLPSFDMLLPTGEANLLLGVTRDGYVVAFE